MGRRERPGGVDAILRIRDTASIDYGQYGCRAENEIGYDYETIVLEEMASGIVQWLLDHLTHLACGVGGIIIVLVIMSIVYCCRSKPKNPNRNSQSQLEEGFLTNDKPIIKRPESYRGSYLPVDVLDRMETSSIESQANSLSRLVNVNRPLQNLPQNIAGYYGNAMLNSRMEDDRMSSSSGSQSQYPIMPQESWGRPPLNGSGRRRSHSPYTTGSEMVDFSANSTMSSVMSKGSRSSRSQPQSTQVSSGEESPLMNPRRSLANDINGTYRLSNPSITANSRYIGNGGGSQSDGEEMGRGRRLTGRDGNLSDGEEGRSRGGSGYHSDGGTSRSGRSLARMRRVSEENHDAREDELETLSE